MQSLTDEQVMLKYQEGEMAAMDELLRRYKNPIYQYTFRLSANAAEAQDITQEVFLNLHEHRYSYEPRGKFSSWLFSIAHNLCISRLRKKKWLFMWPRKQDDPDQLQEFKSLDLSPKELASGNEFSDILKQCILNLPFLQREALVLREYQNLDYAEIAKILKKPLSTVKTLIYRARQNLKEKLAPYIEEGRIS